MGDQSAPPTPNAPPAPDLSSLYGDSGKLVAAPPATPTTPAPASVDEGFLHSIATSMGLDPEQVVKTAKAIKTNPVATAKTIGSEAADEAQQIVEHPVNTAEQTLAGTRDLITNPEAQASAKARLTKPGIKNKAAGAVEYLESGIPVVGSNIVKADEQGLAGNVRGEAGTLVGTVAPFLTGEADISSEGSPEAGLSKLDGKKVGQTRPDVEIRATGPDWDRTHSAYVDGKKVGSVGYKVDAQGRAQIYGAQVDPQLRGQGIAQKLYGSIIDEAPTKNATRLTSDSTNTTPAANRVWQKIGEKGKAPVEEITHPNGKPGYQIDFSKPKTQAADPLDQLHGKTGKTVPDYKGIGEVTGVEFRGVQKGIEGAHPGLAIYQDPKSGTSVAVKLDEFSPKKLQEHVDLARERMNGTAQKKSASEK